MAALARLTRGSVPLLVASDLGVLHELLDGGREEFLCVARFPFRCPQLFKLNSQFGRLDEQQLQFPPHDWKRIGRLPRLGSRKWGKSQGDERSQQRVDWAWATACPSLV